MSADETGDGVTRRVDSVAKLVDVVTKAPTALLVIDETATVIAANALAEQLFGESPGKLSGQSVDALVPVSTPPRSAALSKMNHELRTPLNAILGFAQLLQWDDDANLTPKQREMIEHIQKGGESLLALLDAYFDPGE